MKKVNVKPPIQQRSKILSEVLLAELSGKPLDFLRYRAASPKKINTLDEIQQARLISVENNQYFLTFDGLVVLKTKEANQVKSDCQKVFKALAKHYKERIQEGLSFQELAILSNIPLKRSFYAVKILNRGSSTSVGIIDPPINVGSHLVSNESFLKQESFRKMIARHQQFIEKPSPMFLSASNFGAPLISENSSLFSGALLQIGGEEVQGAWEKSLNRLNDDPEGAITSAKSLVESACKQILGRRDIPYSNAADLQKLYSLVSSDLNLDPGSEVNDALKRILGGMASTVNGLAQLRNIHGDSHGKKPGSSRPTQRHARLAVAMAGAMATFLLSTDDGQVRP